MKFSEVLAAIKNALAPKTLDLAKGAIATANTALESISALFAAASLNADELLSGASDSLKLKIESITALAVTAAVTAKEAALNAGHATAIAAKDSELLAMLSAAGVKVEKLDSDSIKTALSVRIESEAQTLLAARGMKPLPEKIEKPLEAKLGTDAEIASAYLAMPHGSAESVAFLQKHETAIWRHHTGKK